jgi:hypothetical protein
LGFPTGWSFIHHAQGLLVAITAINHHEMLENDELLQQRIRGENTILSRSLSEESSYNATIAIKA